MSDVLKVEFGYSERLLVEVKTGLHPGGNRLRRILGERFKSLFFSAQASAVSVRATSDMTAACGLMNISEA